jgi:RNA polymerase sigma-70 factor (ECF subfamily)
MKSNSPINPSSETQDDFSQTRWSIVLRARSDDDREASKALDALCRSYWPPIYSYIRRWSNSPEEAEDRTQSYFLNLLSRGYLDRADPAKGKLRAFLLTDVKFFLSNDRSKMRAEKRGGGQVAVPIDQGFAEEFYTHEPVDSVTPEQLFDRRWALTLLASVMDAVAADYATRGKGSLFEALKQFISWNAGEESYAEVAARLGKSESDIKVNVHRLRKRYREMLEHEVSQTVSSPAEIEAEIRYLASSVV